MSLPPSVEAGLIIGIVLVGLAVEAFSEVGQARNSLPSWQRTAIAALAIGVVWYALFFGLFPPMPIGDTVVAVALTAVLWLGLPFLFVRAFGIEVAASNDGFGIGAHYRPTTDATDPGVYRVVGTSDDVVLLRLTDGEGGRIHTGELLRVPRDALESSFEPASNPDE
ncbi:MAG: hypothetical protein ACI9YT_002865 [Halobacteriales archaeon]